MASAVETIASRMVEICKLRELSLEGTQVVQVPDLPWLTDLDLSETPFSDLAQLGNLGELEELDLSGTRVVNLDKLVQFHRLHTLELDGLSLESLAVIRKFKLKFLGLYQASIRNWEGFGQLPELETLVLGRSNFPGFSESMGMPALEEISLRGCTLDALSNVSQFTSLKRLDLKNAKIKDISALAECKSLVYLNLEDANVEESQVRALQAALPNLKIVRDLADEIPIHWRR